MVRAIKTKLKTTALNIMNNFWGAGVDHSPLFEGDLENNNIEAILQDANFILAVKTEK